MERKELRLNSNNVLHIYFCKWKSFVDKNKVVNINKKIDDFLNILEKRKRTNSEEKKERKKAVRQISTGTGSYKFRFEAQKDIIQYQKDKLKQQEKLIQDLKLKKINEDLKCSTRETENIIRTIFKKSSYKITCRIKNSDHVNKFEINAKPIPKLIREVEKRTIERAHKTKIILERKRAIEENRRQNLESELQLKRTLQEEERKQIVEKIMKRRKRRLDMQQQIRLQQQKETENLQKANYFYQKLMKKLTLNRFKKLIVIKKQNISLSVNYYKRKLIKMSWYKWTNFVFECRNEKIFKVEKFYNSKLVINTFKFWMNTHVSNRQDVQVAKDLYDFKLQSRIFSSWYRHFKIQQTKDIDKAEQHYNNHILLRFYYQWKLLPVINKLEKTKEKKKQKWRTKVKEILHDYEPLLEEE